MEGERLGKRTGVLSVEGKEERWEERLGGSRNLVGVENKTKGWVSGDDWCRWQ